MELSGQFRMFTGRQVDRMSSGDFGRPVGEVDEHSALLGRSHSGGMTTDELAADIGANGVRKPVRVVMGKDRPILDNGHHRVVAARKAGVRKIPGVMSAFDAQDVVNSLARYTPPGH